MKIKLSSKCFRLLIVLMFLVLVSQAVNNTNLETICIPANSSAREKIVLDRFILYEYQVFPVLNDRSGDCLLLHDWYDSGSAKYREGWQFFPFAQFVNDNYDHCCVTGQ